MPRSEAEPVTFCKLLPETKERINRYAEALAENASQVGSHGLSKEEFDASGLFRAAIERIRGQQSASMTEKREFINTVLQHLKQEGKIVDFRFAGGGERHDYEISLSDDYVCVTEAKGCLDGNNTNIFERPPNAEEFVIWSLCQNAGADPRHNVWSGIHTRLGAEIIHRRQPVSGLVVWDMVCGTAGRPCPKLLGSANRGLVIDGHHFPPPCIYVFPKSVPDARNNPNPLCPRLDQLRFLHALAAEFGCNETDVVEVHIEVRASGPSIERRTTLVRSGAVVRESNWTEIKRAHL